VCSNGQKYGSSCEAACDHAVGCSELAPTTTTTTTATTAPPSPASAKEFVIASVALPLSNANEAPRLDASSPISQRIEMTTTEADLAQVTRGPATHKIGTIDITGDSPLNSIKTTVVPDKITLGGQPEITMDNIFKIQVSGDGSSLELFLDPEVSLAELKANDRFLDFGITVTLKTVDAGGLVGTRAVHITVANQNDTLVTVTNERRLLHPFGAKQGSTRQLVDMATIVLSAVNVVSTLNHRCAEMCDFVPCGACATGCSSPSPCVMPDGSIGARNKCACNDKNGDCGTTGTDICTCNALCMDAKFAQLTTLPGRVGVVYPPVQAVGTCDFQFTVRSGRVVFLVIVYKDLTMVERILRRLVLPGKHAIVLHVTDDVEANFRDGLLQLQQKYPGVCILQGGLIVWGTATDIQIGFASMVWLRPKQWDFMVLLGGGDYSLLDAAALNAEITRTNSTWSSTWDVPARSYNDIQKLPSPYAGRISHAMVATGPETFERRKGRERPMDLPVGARDGLWLGNPDVVRWRAAPRLCRFPHL
jgi:hypothetical protein